MPKDYSRTQRVADYLRRELAGVIQLELRDPRIGMLSVTDVEVSRDMAYAKVYYTSMTADSTIGCHRSIIHLGIGHIPTNFHIGNTQHTNARVSQFQLYHSSQFPA